MNYSKSVAMVIATVLSAVLTVAVDGAISPQGWINVALAGVGAIAVAIVPNLDAGIGRYAKGAVAVATAVLTLLATLIDGGLSTPEIIQLVLAGLGAVGVVALPAPQHPAYVPPQQA